MTSVLEERFTLEDLLDPPVLEEVCQAYAKCFGLGVRILNDRGEEHLACCPLSPFCDEMRMSTLQERCGDARAKMARHPLEGSQVMQLRAHCGLRYAVFLLSYQLEPLGRVLVGPFRDPATSPDDIFKAVEDSENTFSEKDVASVPAISQDRLKSVLSLFVKMMNAFLFINAKRLITTRLHLEAVYSAKDAIFKQVELQDSASDEDREEIEKLKNMF